MGDREVGMGRGQGGGKHSGEVSGDKFMVNVLRLRRRLRDLVRYGNKVKGV